MKNKCKHRQKALNSNTRYSIYTDIFWCSLCGATRYRFASDDLNKKYGRWKSPKNSISPAPKI